MRAVVSGVVLLAVAGSLPAQPREPYASAEGKYSVRFPGAPKVAEKTTKTAAGDVTVSIATYALGDGSAYMVSHSDYPGPVEEKNRAEFFNAVRDGVKGADGRLVGNEKELAVGAGKWPAREFTVEKNRQRVRLRVVLRENRLYQVAVIGSSDFVTSRDASAFMDSLELSR